MFAMRILFASTVALGLSASPSPCEDRSNRDSSLFPAEIESSIGEKTVKLIRTGSAIRKRGELKVYAVASYLKDGIKVHSSRELAEVDSPKQLHLVFMLTVSGDDMARMFQKIFRQNYPEPVFSEEIKTLTELFQRTKARKGDSVWITHVPKVGLHCRREGKEEILIRNVDFSRAVWDNYFGKHNSGEDVKRELFPEH